MPKCPPSMRRRTWFFSRRHTRASASRSSRRKPRAGVVTSQVTAMPEVAGEGACLVDPYDVASIRNGILRVIDDASYRDFLVHRGFENVGRFDPRLIASQYARLYEEVSLH